MVLTVLHYGDIFYIIANFHAVYNNFFRLGNN